MSVTMSEQEQSFYLVEVYDIRLSKSVRWGPFLRFEAAEQCVINLAAKSDVIQAFIRDSSLSDAKDRFKSAAEIWKSKKTQEDVVKS